MQQDSLFSTDSSQPNQAAGPVTCLGKTFANDQARRNYFLALLAEKLKDPEFRKIEGFPIGSDEDILNLSDPPYYTACPNPWIGDFIAEWEAQKPASDEEYHREPFAADVSEGKNDPIYNAHSYHTKVPHKAIMRYILHYTNPGDIVFDGFCGTGMTGVAAQMCGDRDIVMSLGYQIKSDGVILQEEIDDNGKKMWQPFSALGTRQVILNDLSPIATFISNNYNSPVNIDEFKKEADHILKEIENECGWMYETKHSDGRNEKINYTVWSDVFVCQECSSEIVFWDVAVDKENWQVKDDFECSTCGAELAKRSLKRSWVSYFDENVGEISKLAKQIPVLIHYKTSGNSYTKKPDDYDVSVLDSISNTNIPYWYPIEPLPDGDKMSDPRGVGIQNASEFYTKRALYNLAKYSDLARSSNLKGRLLVNLTSSAIVLSRQYRFRSQGGNLGAGGGPMNGTLYVPSLLKEIPVTKVLGQHIDRMVNILPSLSKGSSVLQTGSLSSIPGLPDDSVDYLFIDPPFGANIMYSELNFLWEAWLKVKTNSKDEAIENRNQRKGSFEYRQLMANCFSECYRVLKPGRWITVEFSNTKAAVWNSIQTALTDAGFIIANVSSLDKKQGSFNAVTNTTSVKQDLIISAYKPKDSFEARFQTEAQTEDGVWDFVRTHLNYVPITKKQGALLQFVPERDPRILFDQMVAYFVRKGYPVPISSQEFQFGLTQRFIERDGMFFLPEQAADYDKKKLASGELMQSSLFVKDEASAIDWLRQLLKNKPQTFADINPLYMQQLGGFSKHEVTLELRELLSQNFLCFDAQDEVPDQIHSYLSSNWKELRNLAKNDPALIAKAKDRWYVPDPNKAGDLEKLREKSLLKEFEEYKAAKKKLKVFRIEAVRTGFKTLWEQQEFAALIAVAEKLPSNVLEEDPVLLMYYDQAVTLSQVDTDDEW
ncbi:DNA methyltransferase [Aeromonas veronii]|uniref:DNA methyltransferase n=1 Tax=Aeromonas veronii TaxID=654 RepID=UPI003007601B